MKKKKKNITCHFLIFESTFLVLLSNNSNNFKALLSRFRESLSRKLGVKFFSRLSGLRVFFSIVCLFVVSSKSP
jgi:hypothetical protein